MAYEDQQRNEDNRVGYMYCYCKSEMLSEKSLAFTMITFPDGQQYCSGWFRMYVVSNSFVYIVPICIMMINIIIKALLRSKSKQPFSMYRIV